MIFSQCLLGNTPINFYHWALHDNYSDFNEKRFGSMDEKIILFIQEYGTHYICS